MSPMQYALLIANVSISSDWVGFILSISGFLFAVATWLALRAYRFGWFVARLSAEVSANTDRIHQIEGYLATKHEYLIGGRDKEKVSDKINRAAKNLIE